MLEFFADAAFEPSAPVKIGQQPEDFESTRHSLHAITQPSTKLKGRGTTRPLTILGVEDCFHLTEISILFIVRVGRFQLIPSKSVESTLTNKHVIHTISDFAFIVRPAICQYLSMLHTVKPTLLDKLCHGDAECS